jgi:hypothetical protein
MQTVSATTTELTKSTTLVQLHAEDTASRLSLLETGAITRPANIAEPITPTTTVVRTDTDKQPNGLGEDLHVRGQDLGVTRPPDLPSANGTFHDARQSFDRSSEPENLRVNFTQYPQQSHQNHHSQHHEHQHHHSQHRTSFGTTPKMDFPKFDGDDHQIWVDNCELYFDIYGVSPPMKVKFAALNVVGNAALWLKTVQKRRKFVHREELTTAVVDRWGKSKHTFYMRQMLAHAQLGCVDEYTTKFNTLKHQILLEDPYTSEVLFVDKTGN